MTKTSAKMLSTKLLFKSPKLTSQKIVLYIVTNRLHLSTLHSTQDYLLAIFFHSIDDDGNGKKL